MFGEQALPTGTVPAAERPQPTLRTMLSNSAPVLAPQHASAGALGGIMPSTFPRAL